MLVGQQAPNFVGRAFINGEIVSDFSLESFRDKRYVFLIFYPKDFTAICQSELVAFQERLADFESRDTALVACSTDTADVHAGAAKVPQNEGGLQGITFPIIGDANKTIATNYGVLSGEYEYDEAGFLEASNEMISLRASFLIDKSGMVQHESINFFTIGRNVDEALRMVDALRHVQENGAVCMANWKPA
ncbi:MAG: peroxiredoxin [Bacteroidetes bacterium]|nr:peroxiredoxin [Bacteroidota bacterium]MDA1335767.1 peroxiredoxin [Bacteroidota bacterium]